MCDVQTLKKFTDRPSPPRAASDPGCQGKTFKGNDGNDWISKPTVKGVYRWTKIVIKAPKAPKTPKTPKAPKTPKTPKTPKAAKSKLELYTVLQLRDAAREMSRGVEYASMLTGYSTARKQDLINMLIKAFRKAIEIEAPAVAAGYAQMI